MIKSIASAALAVLVLSAAGSATAAYVTFTGVDNNGNAAVQVASTNSTASRNAFFANLVAVGTQDFETFSPGANAASISPMSFGAAGNASFSGSGSVASNGAGTTNGAGRYSVPGGTRYWETDAGSGNFELTFSSTIAAFGFYGIDLGDFAGTLQLQLFDAANSLVGTQNITTAAANVADGSILYYGILAGNAAEEFNRVRFVSTGGSGDIFAFDSFSIGTRAQVSQVPEPATLALVGCALLGLGLSRRKRI